MLNFKFDVEWCNVAIMKTTSRIVGHKTDESKVKENTDQPCRHVTLFRFAFYMKNICYLLLQEHNFPILQGNVHRISKQHS